MATVNEKISVILTVYNGEKVLARCLDSIISQTYKNLEIIVVNDGSTDGTQAIIESYIQKDCRVLGIYQENAGVSAARNLGISKSSSDLITFIDDDDWLEKDMIEFLYNNLLSNDADISICSFYKDYSNNQETEFKTKNFRIYNRIEALEHILYDDEIKSYPWAKLYKKALFRDLQFPVGRIYEDYAFTYLVLNNAQKVVKSNTPKYHYVQYDDSLSNAKTPKKEYHLLLGAFERYDFATRNPEIISDWKYYTNKNARLFFSIIKGIVRLTKPGEMEREFEYIRQYLKPFYKKNLRNIRHDYSLKILSILVFPKLYFAFLRLTKKNRKDKNVLNSIQ